MCMYACMCMCTRKISTQDRTARDEQTTPEDTAHATAHPDPKTTTAKMPNAQAATDRRPHHTLPRA